MTDPTDDPVFNTCIVFAIAAFILAVLLGVAYGIADTLGNAEAAQAAWIGGIISTVCIFLPFPTYALIAFLQASAFRRRSWR